MTHVRSIRLLSPPFTAVLTLAGAAYSTPLWAEPNHDPVHEHGFLGSVASEGLAQGDSSQSGVRYSCPMHPEVVSDAPGRCPHCGMKLVEQEEAPENWTQQ